MSSYWSQNNCFWVSSKHSVELMFACFFSPLENFLLVKGCEFWPMLDTYGHWALSVLKLVSPTVWGPVTYTYCRAFHSGAVITWFYDLGLLRLEFEHQTFRMQSRLRHRRDWIDVDNMFSTNWYNIELYSFQTKGGSVYFSVWWWLFQLKHQIPLLNSRHNPNKFNWCMKYSVSRLSFTHKLNWANSW